MIDNSRAEILRTASIRARHQEPGQRLRRARERLGLRYRDVEEASKRIARLNRSEEFVVGLSRLADIEHKGTIPSFYKCYSLCAIYRLKFAEVLKWYGADLARLAADSAAVPLRRTHSFEIDDVDSAEMTDTEGSAFPEDARKTVSLNRILQKWGEFPIELAGDARGKNHRYGFIGTDDWSMYPLLAPGSFVQIDESKRRIANSGWTHEMERPVYFLEHREGYSCCWCLEWEGMIVLQPKMAPRGGPIVFRYPGEVEVIGQVVAVAMRLDLGRRRHIRS